jgi:hypothetical protein
MKSCTKLLSRIHTLALEGALNPWRMKPLALTVAFHRLPIRLHFIGPCHQHFSCLGALTFAGAVRQEQCGGRPLRVILRGYAAWR